MIRELPEVLGVAGAPQKAVRLPPPACQMEP